MKNKFYLKFIINFFKFINDPIKTENIVKSYTLLLLLSIKFNNIKIFFLPEV